MADQKVSDLPSLNGADVDAADLLYIIDSSAGTAGSKKITIGQYQLAPYSAGTANGVMYLNGSNVVTTGSALVFDGTNLGLGVTPSAWGAGVKAVQFASGAFAGSGTSALSVGNAYFDGTNYRYLVNGFAAYHAVNNGAGQHAFYVAPSGTAGNAISFTQAMTLDASGNLAVGTSTTTNAKMFSFVNDATLPGLSVRQDGAGPIQIWQGSGGNERARITSGGDLLVGTTTASAVGNTIFGTATPGVIHQNNNAATTGFVFTSYRRSSVEIGSVSQNGTTAVLFNTTSDRRLKDNIVPAPSASDDIDAIQIVSHDWKSAPGEHVKYGVVAQDLHAVAPQAVLQGDDGDEIEKTWGVDYSKLVPMLIKEIQSLRARVAALEAQ